MDANERCDQDIDVTGLDLLNGAQVQVRVLRQLFLGDVTS